MENEVVASGFGNGAPLRQAMTRHARAQRAPIYMRVPAALRSRGTPSLAASPTSCLPGQATVHHLCTCGKKVNVSSWCWR
ncbi:uncharacterized protein PHACADRAFT_265445 [Phanerochaete carnosa HHB-10118-sp]|uniref:Uncharacterized protein n=1 Tax=Phanerochaete carnosa (strain HHB-10118-sp) TaxID=650164 RepID=K5WHR6_PHACS|nr:uncharacterized protein PHACADRAFT_262964 [Phanerochaete carnosa HHB-10118-sp]XP_007401824.1 uncharacterized protein PHACADRAFT_265445 [Phanerochaete carnosa HHB-10118-sp]EKM49772.1 hypothetical protein PHACADRAFT_265445 [Phanerochaete carnosa HHB-10118-sp]EKM51020.1 hypothetical protein PHACADRAFT_262964 [Phanerochaete carnosa HHB-10118-sp]